MSPQAKSDLARQHLTRASGAFEAGDLVVGVTFLHLSAEAAIVALSERHGITTERQHWRKAEAATELNARGILSTDLSPILAMLNQARKDAGYEGEDPDFGVWTAEDLLSIVKDAVHTAEGAARAQNRGEETTHPTQDAMKTNEGSDPEVEAAT